MTGGNYWMPDAILYQDSQNMLRLGGGLTTVQIDALNAGKDRARQQLEWAASLEVTGDTLKITNLTGHKLISGYPEGRRMWLNVNWFDGSGNLLREDGAYGPLQLSFDVDGDGSNDTVNTILDPYDPNSKVYEAHYGMTQDWAAALLSLGYDPNLPLSYDRVTGAEDKNLGQLAAELPGTYYETFHFVLNNYVAKDNRIPPYGFSYDEAKVRNALPVPAGQYGNPGAGGAYNYWDEITLSPPPGAVYATIDLLYQPTSWEYVQFLYLANNGQNPFLADEGVNMLRAWLANGQAAPHIMASTTWGAAPAPACVPPAAPLNLTATEGKRSVALSWALTLNPDDLPDGGQRLYYDQAGKLQLLAELGTGVTSYQDKGLARGVQYCYVVTAWNDCDGDGVFDLAQDMESAVSDPACASPR
jgi:hypothetical protein